ncbi:Glutamate receptor 2 [Branchiostoma belcheri]|nr:Glutamate receptor 2 [Branchiostoma belcheri]
MSGGTFLEQRGAIVPKGSEEEMSAFKYGLDSFNGEKNTGMSIRRFFVPDTYPGARTWPPFRLQDKTTFVDTADSFQLVKAGRFLLFIQPSKESGGDYLFKTRKLRVDQIPGKARLPEAGVWGTLENSVIINRGTTRGDGTHGVTFGVARKLR